MSKDQRKPISIQEFQREQPEELTPEAAEEAQGGLGGLTRLLMPTPPPIEPSVTPLMSPSPPPV